MSRVFISYRRGQARWVAGRIYDRLSEALGRDNIFFDVASIEPGEDFVQRITDIVGRCDVLLAVIGPDWMSAQDKSGRRRIDNANDWIRIEIAAALERNIRVVPVLVDGAEMPDASHLPEQLAPLVRRQAHDLSFNRFQEDLETFVHVLHRILGSSAKKEPAPESVPASPPPLATELPFTISIETFGGVATPLIARGASLPATFHEIFSTAADNQSTVEVQLFAGDAWLAKDNAVLSRLMLDGILPAGRGVPKIDVSAFVDTSLTLKVTARDEATGRLQDFIPIDLGRVKLFSPPVSQTSPVSVAELPFTLSLETADGVTTRLLAKGTALPAEAACTRSVSVARERMVGVTIFGGDRKLAQDNVRVGVFQINLLAQAPLGGTQIEIRVRVDSALRLVVTLVEKETTNRRDFNPIELAKLNLPASAPRTEEAGWLSGMFGRMNKKPSIPENPDLRYDLTLSFEESLTGAYHETEINGKRLRVAIPAGIADGNRLRILGEGQSVNGSPPGNLYIFFKVVSHPLYERRENDLYIHVSIGSADANNGTTIDLPTLPGREVNNIEVPPGVKSGTQLRLAGKGFPSVADASKPGDLYVVVNVR